MKRIFVIESGNTLNAKEQFLKRLSKEIKFKEVKESDCDIILLLCPVISRVGTDIEAALKECVKDDPEPKKFIILVVLHHTYDKEHVVPDSNKYRQDKIYIVNCLFHEDGGLLKDCDLNNKAIRETSENLKDIKVKIRREKANKPKKKKKEWFKKAQDPAK